MGDSGRQHVIFENLENFGGINNCARNTAGISGKEEGPLGRIFGGAPMRAFYQVGIERNYIHQHAKPSTFLKQAPGDSGVHEWFGWIQKQFDRVIAWFAVNVHCSREVWSATFIEPVIISKP